MGNKFRKVLQKFSIVSVAFVYVTCSYVSAPFAYAVESDPAAAVEQLPADPAPAPVAAVVEPPAPTPPPKYVYDEATGLWSNGTYTWNPNTNATTPVTQQTYSYNPTSQGWDTTQWAYNPSDGAYTAQPPQPALATTATIDTTGLGSTNAVQNPVATTSIKNTGPDSINIANTGNIDQTGPDSLNIIDTNDNSGLFFAGFFNADISTSVNSSAQSGNASVLQNTIAGNAQSGNAAAIATIIAMVQSTWGVGNFSPDLYSANIQGDYIGDILLNPQNLAVQNGSVAQPNNLQMSVTESVAIDNNVNLLAQSGNATVSHNTEAGSAKTGDAYALATIMNLISSSIAAQRSFIGMLNVYGNLEGDILLPESIKQQLLSANVPVTQVPLDTSLELNNTSTYAIDNNVIAQATTGAAGVIRNTDAGNATTGQAHTNVTVFNLTGQQVIAENALLVFVNVMGEWVGFITNAPSGATAAMMGSGVSSPISGNNNYDIKRDFNIDNNVSVTAKTGDAEVSNNTTAGNATTGDAYAGANIMNVVDSNISLSGWFGVLFLNLFGNWHGSFGTDTAYGGYSTRAPSTGGTSTPPTGSTAIQTFVLSSTGSGNTKSFKAVPTNFTGGGTNVNTPVAQTTVADSGQKVKGVAVVASESAGVPPSSMAMEMFVIGSMLVLLIGGSTYAIRRTAVQRRQALDIAV